MTGHRIVGIVIMFFWITAYACHSPLLAAGAMLAIVVYTAREAAHKVFKATVTLAVIALGLCLLVNGCFVHIETKPTESPYINGMKAD